jgi:hypothetical protein
MPHTQELEIIEQPNMDSLKRVDAPAIWNAFRAKAETLKLTAISPTPNP